MDFCGCRSTHGRYVDAGNVDPTASIRVERFAMAENRSSACSEGAKSLTCASHTHFQLSKHHSSCDFEGSLPSSHPSRLYHQFQPFSFVLLSVLVILIRPIVSAIEANFLVLSWIADSGTKTTMGVKKSHKDVSRRDTKGPTSDVKLGEKKNHIEEAYRLRTKELNEIVKKLKMSSKRDRHTPSADTLKQTVKASKKQRDIAKLEGKSQLDSAGRALV
eukprot:Lankesteria_metandrocarpae@DN9586_c0_g1_i1.p1